MESESVAAGDSPPANSSDKGLKKGAIGFMDGLAIGLDSTAPGLLAGRRHRPRSCSSSESQTPGCCCSSFVPMFFIAAAFYYMNRAVQDCGTSFTG